MQALRSHEQIRDANTRYHDVAASTYDSKWGIDFGGIGRAQVLGKARKLLGSELATGFDEALEVGAGTGYFSLNLMRAGTIRELTCTDISAGMLTALSKNAERLGLENVDTVQTDAESLPFADASFDLILGHAILHHLPDLDRAFGEFHRVLRPGGRMLFAGEPSFVGDRLARLPKRAATAFAPPWRRLISASPAPEADPHEHAGHELESEVDIHAFRPADLDRLATGAGFRDVTVTGEELVANWFGWFNRGLEASVKADDVPMWWRRYAFHGYLALQKLDARILEPRLPPALFYNLLLTARKP
ncbi:MAG TPA: class I SAM-dependent methyltransferase [Solirubrobacteraceae bacterium]|jgi:SAM-dependent methyltransferase|nr:class I SAM-dependent methyltransferase [Solirubrobacteraceae bacterium]